MQISINDTILFSQSWRDVALVAIAHKYDALTSLVLLDAGLLKLIIIFLRLTRTRNAPGIEGQKWIDKIENARSN